MRANRAAVLFFAVLAASSVRAVPPQFEGEGRLSGLRIFVPSLKGASQVPAKPVQVVQYVVRQGDRSWREERSPADELWRTAQTAAGWIDRSGNELTLARMALKFPPALAGRDILPEAFEALLEDPDQRIAEGASGDELAAWMKHYLNDPLVGAPVGVPMGRAPLVAVSFPTADPCVLAYAVSFDSSQPGQERAPRGWLAFVMRLAELPGQGDVERFETSFLRRLRAVGRFADLDEGKKAVARLSSRDAAEEIPMDARRAHAVRSIELLDDWWHMDSPHYVVLCDAPGGAAEADRLLGELEALRPRYAALVPPFADGFDETSVVRLFRTDEEFARYLSSSGVLLDGSLAAGFFDPQRQELVVRPASRRSGADPTATIRHEGFHQYLDDAWGRVEASPWFNEGSAKFFECYEPNGSRFSFREQRGQGETLERLARNRDIDWTALLRTMLFLDYPSFYNPPGGDPALCYSFSYGLMYFLYRGAPQLRGKPYADVLPAYARTLRETRDPVRATLAAFRMGDDGRDERFLKRFADDLRAFWRNESARRNARSAPIP